MAAQILVTGDLVLDVNIYAGQRNTPDSEQCGTRIHRTPGGAMIPFTLLRELAGKKPDPAFAGEALQAGDVKFGLKESSVADLANWPEEFHASNLWQVVEVAVGKKKENRWFPAKPVLGYGFVDKPAKETSYPATPSDEQKTSHPCILVIDDGMLGFRKRMAERCWPKFLADGPEAAPDVKWIVLKMSSPLGHGDLWHSLAEKWKERLILIVSAADLRRADLRLSQGLSWDQTAEDFLAELDKDGPLSNLCGCRHLVVTMGSDGAVWLSNPGDPAQRRGHLVFDRQRGEGEFDQESGRLAPFGSLSAMTASIAWRLWYEQKEVDLLPALRAGLSAARVLRESGHGLAGKDAPGPNFPLEDVVREISLPIVEQETRDGETRVKSLVLSKHSYSSVELPLPAIEGQASAASAQVRPEPWTILKSNTECAVIGKSWPKDEKLPALFGTARRLALFGPGALGGVPFARFGKLLTMDRGDMESLRSIRHLMLRYKAQDKPKTPLSIAVFGAPGSGKSFGLKQIAKSIFHDDALEFNLSQFKGPEELYGAYHQVRDKILAGFTPVVFWDEFDSREFFWLQYLLAPMQDGVFQEGQLTHSIGKCVFVFAGGTSYDYRYFGPPAIPGDRETSEQKKARRDFVLKKGPDFKSRLTTCLNVLGPNPRKLFSLEEAAKDCDPWYDDPSDIEYPVRRAILLRGLLGCGGPDDANKPLKIDPGLLTALLEVGHYRNGARSMEKLMDQIVQGGAGMPSRANLPPREILELLVEDVDLFNHKLSDAGFGGDIEILAQGIHKRYVEQNQNKPGQSPLSLKDWKDLSPDLRASNRAAALRIVNILAAVGLECVPGRASNEELAAVEQILKANLEMLARMEHDGWMDEKKRQGWVFAKTRVDAELKHPLLIEYGYLPESEKEKDRDSILQYSVWVAANGCKIVFKNSQTGTAECRR